MEFIDNTGHIFSLPSFDEYPFGYEFEENQYIFWFDDVYTNTLSINNYYIKKINLLIPCFVPDNIWYSPDLTYVDDSNVTKDIIDVTITIDSQLFNLINVQNIQSQINENGVTSMPKLDKSCFVNELNNESLQFIRVVENNQKFLLVPFYVIVNSEEEGTWSTNILIHVKCDDYESFVEEKWCPITVGGVFQDEHEELTINGTNIGINLPMDLFRAIYQKSFYDETFDEQLYNEKLREYLLNYMGIRGELGNFNSAIKSLKWFGYGDIVTLTKLWETDNQFKHQYLIDYFDINNDFIESYRTFRNSTYVRLHILANRETGEYNEQNFDNMFWGENQPILEDLLSKMVPVTVGSIETFDYYKPYYDYTFNELALKLACLKYYYEKYFLPIHLQIHSASLTHRVYANDLKFLNKTSLSTSEYIIDIADDDFDVVFPTSDVQYLSHQIHYVDEIFNEFEEINDNKTLYKINDTCLNIPISFTNHDKYYDCVLLLEKLNKNKYYTYQLNINEKLYNDDVIKIYDTKTTMIAKNDMQISVSEDGISYTPYVDYTKLYNNLSKKYSHKLSTTSQDDNFQYNDRYDNYSVRINNKDYVITDNQRIIHDNDKTIIIPSKNDIAESLFNDDTTHKASIVISIIPKLYYRIKYNSLSLYKVTVNDIDYTNMCSINFQPSSVLLYESHFTINQMSDDDTSIYRDFVIYPKMLCDVNVNKIYNKLNDVFPTQAIEYFIGETFRIRLLVNNKWYTYEFMIKIPDFNIHFGTLQYKYFCDDDELNRKSNFNQLSYLGDENDKLVKFNSFMYEPRLVEVNHINFMKDYIKYAKLTNIKYINGDDIILNKFCYYIDMSQYDEFDTQHIYITDEMYQNDLYIPVEYFTRKNLFLLACQDSVFLMYDNDDENTFVLTELDKEIVLEGSFDGNYVKFVYDETNNVYHTETSDYKFNIFETLYSDETSFYNKYIEQHHITMNDAHLNQVHVFDLYRRDRIQTGNYLKIHNNIDIRCKNLRFIHKSYNDLLYVQGRASLRPEYANAGIVRNDTDENAERAMSNYFNTRDDVTMYSVYWNDYVELDEEKSNTPSGYAYYQVCDVNGHVISNEYTDEPTTDYIVPNDDYNDYFIDKSTGKVGTLRYRSLNQFNNHIGHNLAKYNEANDDNMSEFYDVIPDYKTIEDIKDEIASNVGSIYENEENINNYNELLSEYIARNELIGRLFDLNFIYNEEENKIFTNDDNSAQVKFKVAYQKYDYTQNTYVDYVPTVSEYYDFAQNIFDNPTNEYRVLISFYIVKTKTVQNIEHQYTGEIQEQHEYDTHGNIIEDAIYYTGVVDGKQIRLVPYTSLYYIDKKLIDYEDKTLSSFEGKEAYIIDTQYGEHYFDIDSVAFLNDENDTINQYWIKYDADKVNELKQKNYVSDNKFRHLFDEDLLYNNYLVKHLTGIKGHFMIQCDARLQYYVENNGTYTLDGEIKQWDGFKTVICSINENNELNNSIYMNGDIIEFTGKEKDVSVFFMITDYPDLGENEERYFTATINPQVIQIKEEYQPLKYEYDKLTSDDENTFTVTLNGKDYIYEQNTSYHIWELYNDFFENIKYDDDNDYIVSKVNIDNWFDYDFYLMHDYKYWFGVFISRYTCNYAKTINDLMIDSDKHMMYFLNTEETEIPEYLQYQSQYYIDGEVNEWYYDWNMIHHIDESEDKPFKYKLEYNRSAKKFLPNRHYFKPSEGINHFAKDDVIVATLSNNERLPININIASKWYITPLSIGVSNTAKCESNAEMVIIDTPENNTQYERGYYNVDMRYSIDTYTTQQFKQVGKFRID